MDVGHDLLGVAVRNHWSESIKTSRQTRRHSTYVFIFMSRRERLHQWTKYHHRWWNDQKDDLFRIKRTKENIYNE